jgi:hypothetical protein
MGSVILRNPISVLNWMDSNSKYQGANSEFAHMSASIDTTIKIKPPVVSELRNAGFENMDTILLTRIILISP